MSKTLIICDIDGVLADCSHRLHYLEEKNYGAFYGAAMADDTVIDSGKKIFDTLYFNIALRVHKLRVYKRVMLTGRPERTRALTSMWLRGNGISYEELLMRRDGDYRPSPEVKVELLKSNFKKKKLKEYDLIYFIDDDPENVKAVCKAFPQITGITFGTKRFK